MTALTCGAFGCEEPAVVRGIRGEEWVPGDYCVGHGRNVRAVARDEMHTCHAECPCRDAKDHYQQPKEGA